MAHDIWFYLGLVGEAAVGVALIGLILAASKRGITFRR